MLLRPHPALLSIALLVAPLMPDAASAAVGASGAYERFVEPQPLEAGERQLLRWARRWNRGRGRRLGWDVRLARAAQALVHEVPTAAGERFDLDRARRLAQSWGWTDGTLAAVTLRVPAAAHAGEALATEMEAHLAASDVDRVGLALTRTGAAADGGRAVLALFSRRTLRLLPLPSRVEGAALRLRGSLAATLQRGHPPAAPALRLVIGWPGGAVEDTAIAVRGDRFDISAAIPRAGRAGVAQVQVLADEGAGPRIAAAFPVRLSAEGAAAAPATLGMPPEPREAAADPEVELARLVLSVRSSQSAQLPSHSALLSDIARAHAEDMRDHGFFAHASPATGLLTDRLHRRGIRFALALENIGAAASAWEIVEGWMNSPAHRANLLTAETTIFGVGAAAPTRPGGALVAVLVLAAPGDEGDAAALAALAHDHIARTRRDAGRAVLARDPQLDSLAARHCRNMAAAGRLSATAGARQSVVDTVLRDLDFEEAAADVYQTDSPSTLPRSANALAAFSRIGVGVWRDEAGADGRLWVTVLYAGDGG